MAYEQTACDTCGEAGPYTEGSRHSFNGCGGTYRGASARLLRAAPDLLAALIETRDYLAEFFEEGREHRVIREADAAIAKAEGR